MNLIFWGDFLFSVRHEVDNFSTEFKEK